MKKKLIIIGVFGLTLVQAQVGINTDTPDVGADLELGSNNKALLLNRVANESDIGIAVEGMIIFDATQHCFKGYQNSTWVNITHCEISAGMMALNCANSTFSPTVVLANTNYSGTLSIPYTGGNGGDYDTQSINSTGVTGLTASISAGVLANGTGTLEYNVNGTPTSVGTATFNINIGGKSCSVSLNVEDPFVLPSTITLNGGKHIIVSVYDTDYSPYSTPTSPSSMETNVPADGTLDPTIDIQGKITTTGINVKIPVQATASGTLEAHSITINIPSDKTEDGIARDISLSWASQSFTTSTTSINATVKSVGGDLLIKKLDVQRGIGNDYLGSLIGEFTVPSNSVGDNTSYQIRAIAVIPDRNYGDSSHKFAYLPVEVNGIHNVGNQPYKKEWLNMNLGADYANTNSSDFNVFVNKTGYSVHNDPKTYGSLFQWQRKADSHEFRTSNATENLASSWTDSSPAWDGQFIMSSSSWNYNWVDGGKNDDSGPNIQLWKAGGSNNPCPDGYHVPTKVEWEDFHEALTGYRTSNGGGVYMDQSILPNFATAGYRFENIGGEGSSGYYWSSESYSGRNSYHLTFDSGNSDPVNFNRRKYAMSARCIKD